VNITVLGAGAWGTALAISAADRHPVRLWARDPAQAQAIDGARENRRYLPGRALPASIRIDSDLAAALADAELLIAAVPTGALGNLLAQVAALEPASAPAPLVWACKGFDAATGELPHQIVARTRGAATPCGVLSGPSFADEIARGLPAALTLAARDSAFAASAARALHSPRLRVYSSSDVIGVEIGGAAKNVLAIAAGICDGLALGLNARAALITRGLAELGRLGSKLGGRTDTLMGLAGAGDLILTCTGDLSRNRRVGLQLAEGVPLADILARLGHVAEGVTSARALNALARDNQVEMPICEAVLQVLDGHSSARAAVEGLMRRDPRGEAG
jgi:glycerol-3-phosphate dehydrogenase (NAD(P)+)